jgi:hypothetical protein
MQLPTLADYNTGTTRAAIYLLGLAEEDIAALMAAAHKGYA